MLEKKLIPKYTLKYFAELLKGGDNTKEFIS